LKEAAGKSAASNKHPSNQNQKHFIFNPLPSVEQAVCCLDLSGANYKEQIEN
jgi:hypothetical protein